MPVRCPLHDGHEMRTGYLFLLMFLLLGPTVSATIELITRERMIEKAEVIAVVTVYKTRLAKTQGSEWAFYRKAEAKVEAVLKGTLPETITIYCDEKKASGSSFSVRHGRYLVFLKWDGPLLIGAVGGYSGRKITGDEVGWFGPDHRRPTRHFKPRPLAEVLKNIHAQLDAKTDDEVK